MARLPIPGSDDGTWGDVLNDFLVQSLNTDGTLKDTAVTGLAGQPVATTTPTNNQVLAYNATSQQWEPMAAAGAPLATTSAPGVVQLTNDLGGTATSPTVPGLATKADTSALTAHTSATTSVHGIANTANLETTTGSQAKVDTHNADTTGVHGIADTSVLETTTGAQAKVDTHNADTTNVHGITDTSALETATGAQAKVDTHNTDTTNVHGIPDTSALETTTGSQAKVDTHNADTTAVHGIANTANLETTSGAQAKVDAHVNDASDAHDASAISFQAAGTIAATDVQAAVAEVATDAASALATHAADATIHSSGREIAYAQITSNQLNIATTGINIADVTGLTVTIPPGGVRPIYLTAVVHVTNETSGGRCVIGIAPASATNGFQIIQGGGVRIQTALDAAELYMEVRLAAGTSGTYKVVAQTPDYVPPVDPDPPTHRMNVSASVLTPSFFKAVEA